MFEFVKSKINHLEVSEDDILLISDYYESDRYPGPKYFSPSNEEIRVNLELASQIVSLIEKHFDI